jgi:hypothetical protein
MTLQNQIPNVCNILWCDASWRPSWTIVIISRSLAIFETLTPVVSLFVWPKLLSPKTCFSLCHVSAVGFPSLKQNVIQTRCSLRAAIAKPQTYRNTTMEIRSPTISPTTQLDAACHTDSRRVCAETPIGISMCSQSFVCKIQIPGTFWSTTY